MRSADQKPDSKCSTMHSYIDLIDELRKIADLELYNSMMSDAELVRARAFANNGNLLNPALLMSANRERRDIMAHAANYATRLDSVFRSADLCKDIIEALTACGPEMVKLVLIRLQAIRSGQDGDVRHVSVHSNAS